MEIKQYEIILVNLDPSVGSEMKKTRPCVVLSPNEMNKYLQNVIIAPITNTSKSYPTRLELNNKEITGWIVLDQLRTIDKVRIVKPLSKLSKKEATITKQILKELLID
jgi:mRNA interferase MazF